MPRLEGKRPSAQWLDGQRGQRSTHPCALACRRDKLATRIALWTFCRLRRTSTKTELTRKGAVQFGQILLRQSQR